MKRSIPAICKRIQQGLTPAQIACHGVVLLLALFATALPLHASVDGFVKPTPEEMAMTSVPGQPGAAAVVLYREEITDDNLHEVTHYERIKILTERG